MNRRKTVSVIKDGSAPTTRSVDQTPGKALARALKRDRAAGLQTRKARAATKAALFDRREEITRVDRYLVLGRVGAGAMGTVFAAYDPRLDRRVALKVLTAEAAAVAEDATSVEGRETLVQEARALAQVRHPNVVEVYDAGSFGDQVYLTMELVEGETLRSWFAREEGRTWQTLLRVLIDAGRGLAAVHAAGFVHRDFKPDNVLIGTDGVARVADFGLARRGIKELPDRLETGEAGADSHETSAAGTPAYLAPERALGKPADACSDQFSFCVTVFEGLAGERPFPAIAARDYERRVELPAGLPSWLVDAVVRGLEPDPSDRHASMDELLDAFEAGLAASELRVRRRALAQRWGIALGLAGAIAAGVVGVRRIERDARISECEVAADHVAALWPGRAKEVSEGITASKLSYASETIEKLEPRLAAWAEQWQQTRYDVCLASSVDNTMSPRLQARATGCLDLRHVEVETLLDLLASGDTQAIEHAVTYISGASTPGRCADRDTLERETWPSPEQWDAVFVVRKDLRSAASLEWAGKYEAARQRASNALVRAEALGWAPLVARAKLQLGSLERAAGNYEAAQDRLEDAFFSARRAGADGLAAAAATQLTSTVGVRLGKPEAGLQWGKHAEVLLDQSEAGARLRASLDRGLGSIHATAFDLEKAKARYESAVERLEDAFGPEHPDVATTLGGLATVNRKMGRYPEAKSLQARVVEITERGFGARHPSVSDALNNLAAAHMGAGELDAAGPLLERSLQIREAAFGPEHSGLASTLDNLAKVREAQGNAGEARALYDRSLRILETAFGPDNPRVGRTLSDLGTLVATEGDLEEAQRLFERAYAIVEKAYGPEHPDAAGPLSNLGVIHQLKGNLEEALEMQSAALVAMEKKLGPDHILLTGPLYNLGSLALDMDRPAEAVPSFERCVAINEAHAGEQEYEGSALFMLAKSLLQAGGDRERALGLARDAKARFATHPPPNPEDRGRLDELLAEYDRPD